jgi:hypothetical protein
MGDWLDNLLGGIEGLDLSVIIQFLQWLVGAIVAAFTWLYNLLAAVFNFFYDLAKTIGQFFVTLWDDFFKGIFTSLWSAIVKVHDWLESILGPIVQFIQKIRAWVDWFFQTYVKPFLNILSQVRNFLNILRSFGIKWAAQLDAFLGKVQSDVSGYFLKVQGYLNSIIGIVNSLSDPLGLFRRPTFVMSMRRIFPSFARGISGMPLGYYFPSPRKGAPPGTGPFPPNFDPSNTTQNPPPSGYLSDDDGLGDFGGADPGETLPDDSMDTMTGLDYFNDDLWPDSTYSDPVSALEQLQGAAYGAIAGTPA